jgi:PPOX class probable F420-dependent enzyme
MQQLGVARYVSLTTFRKDGTPVATPVWIVEDDGLLFVWTGIRSGKARRIRNDPHVTIAACDYRGRTDGSVAHSAVARVVPRDDLPGVWALMRSKYGWQLRGSLLSGRLNARLRRRPIDPSSQVFLELTLEPSETSGASGTPEA